MGSRVSVSPTEYPQIVCNANHPVSHAFAHPRQIEYVAVGCKVKVVFHICLYRKSVIGKHAHLVQHLPQFGRVPPAGRGCCQAIR